MQPKAIIQTNISIDKPTQLTRRQLLTLLLTAPVALAQPAAALPTPAPLTGEAYHVKYELIPALEKCLEQARFRLTQLTTSV